MAASIFVVGSSNTDMVVKALHLPSPGETIAGGQFFMFPGGKGANQAVAAARLGGDVTFIAKLGGDVFGDNAVAQFKQEGIRTEYVFRDEAAASGVALITVDEVGENTIVVAPGANAKLEVSDIDKAKAALHQADILLLQLEIPVATVLYAAKLVAGAGGSVILNPAPATALPEEIYKHLYLITPNRTEAGALTGRPINELPAAKSAAKILHERGTQHVIITLGAEGSYFFSAGQQMHIASPKVAAVDTTAAGDNYNGALAVALSEGAGWKEAITFASHAAALSVTRMGAQASAPYRHEINLLNLKSSS